MRIIYKALISIAATAGIIISISGCDRETGPSAMDGPLYKIVKTGNAPLIDGIINDSCWKTAESISLTLIESGKKSAYQTTVRAVYDSEYLYIGFECQDIDAASTITGKDSPVSEQEHISVYIDAGCDSKTYAVIDIAPTGALYDSFILSYRDGESKKILPGWDCEGILSAVSVNGGGAAPGTKDRFWTVELALPFEEFVTAEDIPPLPDSNWRINFYRTELTNVRDISAFSTTGSENTHVPSRFAWLIFSDIE
ncbi:carbohydrate-binding family 9-like protein [Candidatus Latescibacterota bacterium]